MPRAQATEQVQPIIMVHAVTASGLRDDYPLDHERVWSPWELMMREYDRIVLYPSVGQERDRARFEAVEPALVRPSEAFGIIYKDLASELKHNLSWGGTPVQPVYAFVYDWRQDNFRTITQLKDFIEEVIERTNLMPRDTGKVPGPLCESVDLIGHSMGGLVVAGCIAKYSKGGWSKQRVRRVVTLGTPFRGANAAITKLATGGGTLFGRDARERERTMARVTPSVYQLLPSFDGCLDGRPASDIWDPATYQASIVQTIAEFVEQVHAQSEYTKGTPASRKLCRDLAATLLTELLTSARDFRALTNTVRPEMLRADGAWLAIVGVGEKTLIGTGFEKDPDDAARPRFKFDPYYCDEVFDKWDGVSRSTGDETVPLDGATPPWPDAWKNTVVVDRKDFEWLGELGDRFLCDKMGLHSTLPLLNLAQRWIINFLRPQWPNSRKAGQHGRLHGKTLPGFPPNLDRQKVWSAMIPGLKLS
jgi:pimeloyl-ACP methyl ester carboxylesterase